MSIFDNGSKPILSVWISDNDNFVEELQPVPLGDNVVKFPIVLIHGNFVEFSMPDHSLHNKIRFHYLYIDYIDHSVLAFLRSNKPIWDRMGTKLTLWPYRTEKDQSIWDVFAHEIWPIFATNIRHLSFDDGDYLDKLRHHTSSTILTDLDQLNSIDSGRLFPEGIADFEVLNPTAAQALTKWLHTPSRAVDHRNIIKFYGIAMTREHVMLVFELASDGSLLHFLKTYQRPSDVKWTMCVDTASGLA
ncbi:hypothetical protein niasHT_016583 [Heterodera trifolii]|uniref:Serine-threonine/tyrosine-protein kinase catalytic domain-containing protein n=1 Tax=Heterodera trifolii TaxID=157864 RepID=A0ABD2LKF2_9BILA